MIRDDSFLDEVPLAYKPVFMDENPIAPTKIKILKEMITDRFPVSQVNLSKTISYLTIVIDNTL